MPDEPWREINITTANAVKKRLTLKRFRKKNGLSEETLDLIDESRNMMAQGKSINNTDSKDSSRAIRRACRNDRQ